MSIASGSHCRILGEPIVLGFASVQTFTLRAGLPHKRSEARCFSQSGSQPTVPDYDTPAFAHFSHAISLHCSILRTYSSLVCDHTSFVNIDLPVSTTNGRPTSARNRCAVATRSRSVPTHGYQPHPPLEYDDIINDLPGWPNI